MRYVTRDGLHLEGEGAVDIVDALRSTSHAQGRDRRHYTEILAAAARLQTGATIRNTDCATLLADLAEAGLLERIV